MTLNKAIEITQQRINRPRLDWNAEDFKALHLGIEALKTVTRWREQHRDLGVILLPGETEEA